MHHEEPAYYSQLVENSFKFLYNFARNYQSYAFLNIFILVLNMTIMWIINYSKNRKIKHPEDTSRARKGQQRRKVFNRPKCSLVLPKEACLPNQVRPQCEKSNMTLRDNLIVDTSDPKPNRTPLSSIHQCSYGPSRKRIRTPPPSNKMTGLSEECDETLDEITWGCDESVSPVMTYESVKHSERFILSSPERSIGDQLKRKRLCAHRRRKRGHIAPPVNDDIVSMKENIDMSSRTNIKKSPRISIMDMETKTATPASYFVNVNKCSLMKPVPDTAPLKRDESVPVKHLRKQQCKPMHSKKLDSIATFEPSICTQSTKDSEKSNQCLEKLRDGSCGSHKTKQKTRKLNKKRSSLSSTGTLEKPLTSHETINYSNSGEESLSSPGKAETKVDILDQQQFFGNLSESSGVCRRDSWIWFSPETQPSIENFAARPRKFRSQDPRVVALAAEIKRQEELNRDIERTAESLIDTSSSHSLGGAISKTGKYGTSKTRVCRRTKLMPYNKFHKLHRSITPPIPGHKNDNGSPIKIKRSSKSSLASAVKNSPLNKLQKAAKAASEKPEGKSKRRKTLPDKQSRKMSAIKIPNDNEGLSSNSLDTQVDKQADKTFTMNSVMDKDELMNNEKRQTSGMKLNRSRDYGKMQRSASAINRPTSLSQLAATLNELTKLNELNCALPLSPAKLKQHAEPSSSIPNLSSQPVYYYDSDENVLKLSPTSSRDSPASLSNTQYLLSCLEAQLLGAINNSVSPELLQADTRLRARGSVKSASNQKYCDKQVNPPRAQKSKESKKKQLIWSPAYHGTPKSRRSPVQASWNQSTTQLAKSAQPVSNPRDATKDKLLAPATRTDSPGEYSSWLKLYCNQIVSNSNSTASKITCDDFSAEKSPQKSSSPESKLNDIASKVKQEIGASRIEDLVNQEVNTAIHKLLFDSDRSPSSHSQCSTPANLFSDLIDDEKYRHNNNEHDSCDLSDNLFIGEKKNFGETLIVENCHIKSDNNLSDIINEKAALLCDLAQPSDTCVLSSLQSKCSNNSLTDSKFSSGAKSKRTNIYARNYYLGKRAVQKNKRETLMAPLRPPGYSSISRWRKTNITWSKTVSLHLYSPATRPISPRTRKKQKKYEQELKKLKPCLKLTRSLTEQSCVSNSFSDESHDGTLSSPQHVRSVMSDSALTHKSTTDKIHNSKDICPLFLSHSSSFLSEKQRIKNMKSVPTKVNHCPDIYKNEGANCSSPCITKVSSAISKSKIPERPDTVSRKALCVSNSTTTVNRKENSIRQGLNKPTVTVSKNNSSSIVPYRSCKSLTSCRSKLPTRIAQLLFITQTDLCPCNKSSQSEEDSQKIDTSKNSQIGPSEISQVPVKPLESFFTIDTPVANCTFSFNVHGTNFTPQNNEPPFVSVVDCSPDLEKRLAKRKSHNDQSGTVDATSEHKQTSVKPIKDGLYCKNDLAASHTMNSLILDSSQDQSLHMQELLTSKWKNDTPLLPTTLALPQTSSDEEESSQEGSAPELATLCNNERRSFVNSSTTRKQCEVKSMSNQDSGFDESITETASCEYTYQLFPADTIKYGSNPCLLKGGEHHLEMRCQSALFCTEKARCRSVLSCSDKTNCQSLLSCSDKTNCQSVLSCSDRTNCQSVLSCSDHAMCESVLSCSDQSGCPSMLSCTDTSCFSELCHDRFISNDCISDKNTVSSVGKDNYISSLAEKDTNSILSSPVGKNTCIVPSLVRRDTGSVPFLGGSDTRIVHSLMRRDTCNVPSLLCRDTCNVPSLVGRDNCNVSSLVCSDTCNVPSLVCSDTCNVPSLVCSDTCNVPSLVCSDTCNVPSLVCSDTCSVPSLVCSDTCSVPSLVCSDTCNVPSLVCSDTCNVPSLVCSDTFNVPSLRGRDTCNAVHFPLKRHSCKTSSLSIDCSCRSARNLKAQITDSINMSQNMLGSTQDVNNKISHRNTLNERLPFNCFGNISANRQERGCKLNKINPVRNRQGLENKRKSASIVKTNMLIRPSSFPVCENDREDKCLSVTCSSEAVTVSSCEAVKVNSNAAVKVHSSEAVKVSSSAAAKVRSCGSFRTHVLGGYSHYKSHIHEAAGLASDMSGFHRDARKIGGEFKKTSIQPSQPSMSNKNNASNDLICLVESPVHKNLIECSPVSCISQSEEEIVNVQNTCSTGSDIACQSSLESLCALNSQHSKDVSHLSKSNSSLETNMLLGFGEPHTKRHSTIGSLNSNEQFSHPPGHFSHLNETDYRETHQAIVHLSEVDSAHNLTLPPTSSDEEDCENYDQSHSFNTNIACSEDIQAASFQATDKSQLEPETLDNDVMCGIPDFCKSPEIQTVHPAHVAKSKLIIPARSVAFSELIKRF